MSLYDALQRRTVVGRATFGTSDYELLNTGRVLEWRKIGKGLRRELGPACWLEQLPITFIRRALEMSRAAGGAMVRA
jgi:hypothetical protein